MRCRVNLNDERIQKVPLQRREGGGDGGRALRPGRREDESAEHERAQESLLLFPHYHYILFTLYITTKQI